MREPMTCAQVGAVMGLSAGQIHKIERQALRKLRMRYPTFLGIMQDLADELRSHDYNPDLYETDESDDLPEAA